MQKLDAKEFDENIQRQLLDAISGNFEVIGRVGVQNLDALRLDAVNAQKMSRENLQQIGGIFKRSLHLYLEDLSNDVSQYGEDSLKLSKAWFCMQLSLLPNFDGVSGSRLSSLYKMCENQVFNSVHRRSGLFLDFEMNMSMPPEDRFCSIYDFNRKSRIFGYGNKNSSLPISGESLLLQKINRAN